MTTYELKKVHQEAIESYKKAPSKVEHVAGTTDLWTAENEDSYSSLTVTYIGDDWE